jgi:hypothetical protein
MTLRTLIGAAAASLLLASAAVAAASAPAQKCTDLEHQFDKQVKLKETSERGPMTQVMHARALRRDGAKLCVTGKVEAGVKDLQQALITIGEKPAE